MKQTNIKFEAENPVDIFGINNVHIEIIKSFFPKLRIFSRGSSVIASGNDNELNKFNTSMKLIIKYFNEYNHISGKDIKYILKGKIEELDIKQDDIIIYNANNKPIRPISLNQRKIVDAVNKDDLVFTIGPAGTGKTYLAVALAVRALKNKAVKRIILSRPAVEAGENLGFLPGDLKEKLDPYLQPLYDALRNLLPDEKLQYYMERKIIQIAPLAFMRGRTLDDAFVILDEAQNATISQMKMFLTRMGKTSKFIVTGDVSQIDLPKNQESGLVQSIKILNNIEGILIFEFSIEDIVRHHLVQKIIQAYNSNNEK